MGKVNRQAAWLAEHGRLVGQLLLRFNPALSGADAAAMRAALRPPLQLQHLQLCTCSPAGLLRQLEPSRLTRLVIDLGAKDQGASHLLVAALSRLTSLQELAVINNFNQPHDSFPAALAGMPRLTKLRLDPQLPAAAAVAQLPSLLVDLCLFEPDCDASELVAGMNALQQLQTLTLSYGPDARVREEHAASWGALATLRQLELNTGDTVALDQSTLGCIAAATNLTRLVGCFKYLAAGDQLTVLSSLHKLESLKLTLSLNQAHEMASWGKLFSHHLTCLRSLDLRPGKMRQLAHMQLLFHPTQLTHLVLRNVPLGEQGLEMIAANLTQLQRLALLDCNVSTGIRCLLEPESTSLQHVKQFALSGEKWIGEKTLARLESAMMAARPSLDVAVRLKASQVPARFLEHRSSDPLDS
jgi:hypothetical protein